MSPNLLDSSPPESTHKNPPQNLHAYLECKGAEYAPFDPARMPNIFALVQPFLRFSPHIVHILGTNGKGSTGRFITLGLLAQGHSVLHFSSPHLFSFNERFYINGTHVSDMELERAHGFLQHLIHHNPPSREVSSESLCNTSRDILQRALASSSYFEYTTLLAFVLAQDCEYFICEAGLGGEFDSTSVIQDMADVSVFTPISHDHTELLGDDIESIATTKLRAMGRRVFLAPQRYKVVESIAQEIAKQRGATLNIITQDEIDSIYASSPSLRVYAKDFAPFLRENLIVAHKVLESISTRKALDSGVLRRGLAANPPSFCAPCALPFDLVGRAQKLTPNILLDVGHNPECARSVVEIVSQKRVNLVYNSFSQKNVREILGIFKPVIDRLFIMPISHARVMLEADLIRICAELGIGHEKFSPTLLRQMQDETENSAMYVVFGSFSVVEAFLEIWNARR